MSKQVLDGVQVDACLDQEQRHKFSKQLVNVVWVLKSDGSTTNQDLKSDGSTTNQGTGHVHVAGVCISPMGHILTSSHVIKSGVKYVGSCPSWKAGWTSLKEVKTCMAYGLSLLQVEETSSKKTDYTDLAETGVLRVNQHLYGFGHPDLSDLSCVNTFVRGSVEYQCEDIIDLPACVNDSDHPIAQSPQSLDMFASNSNAKFDLKKALNSSLRMVKHLKWAINLDTYSPKTIILMHQDIPLIQIKGFHLGYCGGPVFLSSGHVVGIVLFKLNDINFGVHVSAIKAFLKDIDLAHAHA